MEKNNISDYGSIDSKKFLDDFVREYSEKEKERKLYGDSEIDYDAEFDFEIPDEMDEDLSGLQEYVYQRLSAMNSYYSKFFVENSLKSLFKRIYAIKSNPDLHEVDKRIIEDLLDYIYDYNSEYESYFNAWEMELNASSENRVNRGSR